MPATSRSPSIARGAAAFVLMLACTAASAYQWDDDPPRQPPSQDPAFRAALEACAVEQGLPPPPANGKPREPAKGDAPAKRPDREKMDRCLQGKGFAPPRMREGGGLPPPHDEVG